MKVSNGTKANTTHSDGLEHVSELDGPQVDRGVNWVEIILSVVVEGPIATFMEDLSTEPVVVQMCEN